mmetsp:Transcript_16398/g.24281  ORF Transcript_16398/g.24281 Transcript_16398/m.24281 type:complete len:704 (-) Transcript_16398:402-2513(-)|eukprot:CAMPEP_0194046150 /NCGR_PEP_ID=MMETSP0009_2-20130614/19908_1 /TAXON_ID=210454 /ORGANISM="Grammatophora oceanica, Strain CCMP 410" /LENGTH=703 /DNA_ID=CAMNT_0038691333 /DNA_START=411 /DNA_END=2522 /DNA_ORIENTATION=+
MGTAADWSQIETNVTGTAPTSDLFGGELFGEELIDIYNSETMVANAGDVSSEIPSLPVPEHTASTASKVPVAPPSGTDSVDDGLGAFRPSTSFNDLASLLAPDGTPAPAEVAAAPVPPAATPAPAPPAAAQPHKETKKRAAPTATAEGPIVKKVRAAVPQAQPAGVVTAARRSVVVTTKTRKPVVVPTGHGIKVGPQSASVVKAVKAVQARNGKANTPNPLGVSAAPTVTRKAASGVLKPTVVTSGPAVVTPRVVAPVMTKKTEAAPKAPVLPAPSVTVRREGVTTEADFKSVAQAAVTNLILNASSQKSEKKDTSNKVDISATHIKALTSTNWVAACAGPNGSPAVNAAAQAAAEAKANRARRQNLTPDERARQNRDRNREHARNTRLRKKAYVEELKRTLTEMVAQREASDVEKRHSAQREVEQREVRFRVMEEFLKLRGRNESNFARWSAILENGFSLTLPLTNYRKMAETASSKKRVSGKRAIEQTLAGTSEIMADSACFSAFLQTLGDEDVVATSSAVTTFLYHCDRKNFFMDGCNSVLSFTANSVGAVGKAAPYELTFKGLMRAKFCPASNKLVSAEFSFDSGIIAEQLRELIVTRVVAAPAPMDTCDAVVAETAAHVAVTEADALLESLQMPQLDVGAVPTNITVHPSESLAAQVSVNGSDKESISSDESCEEMAGKGPESHASTVATRRSSRRKD